jgi:hypothetical protein
LFSSAILRAKQSGRRESTATAHRHRQGIAAADPEGYGLIRQVSREMLLNGSVYCPLGPPGAVKCPSRFPM